MLDVIRRATPACAALVLTACVGATLEYGAPASASEEEPAPVEDGGAAAAPAAEVAPEAPAWLDPAVLDQTQTHATELGLAPERAGEQALFMTLAVHFRTNSSELRPESEPALEALRALLEGAPRVTAARVAAHSDARGSAEYNLRLTAARALAVARWLVDHGIACARLDAIGYGEGGPIADNVTAGGRSQNRRVELWIAGVDGSTRIEAGGLALGSPCDPSADPERLLREGLGP